MQSEFWAPTPRPLPYAACLPRAQDTGKAYINNHLHFTILYHKDATTDLARIVGFEVEPYSVHHTYEGARRGRSCGRGRGGPRAGSRRRPRPARPQRGR